ncbi:MAG: hypothetical protein LBE27_00785 [Deltaproteobacteria bacterium]|jgi:hypothetical protein|nr:hypothetical protein [Deltaproteobacteria bacterium]
MPKKDDNPSLSINPPRQSSKLPKEIKEALQASKKCFYGSIVLLNFLCKQSGLDDILEEIFFDETDKIKALVYFNILEKKPLGFCSKFVENYDIPLNPSDLSSDAISELLTDIEANDRVDFFYLWANSTNDSGYLVLDSTSMETDANLFSIRNHGLLNHNEKCEQVNMCYVFGEKSALPLYSNTYNGTLDDVTNLEECSPVSTLTRNFHFQFVMGKGFYSQKNIDRLLFSPERARFYH